MANATGRTEAPVGRMESAAVGDNASQNQGSISEIHAQMQAFRASLKQQASLDKEFSAPSAVNKGKLDQLSRNVKTSLDCLTDLELVDAQKTAHKINEEKAAHHGHSDTLDAMRQHQKDHNNTMHDAGIYNAVVLAAAVESHGHVTENKYFPAGGGAPKSNDNEHPTLHSREDVKKFYTLHPPQKGLPAPID